MRFKLVAIAVMALVLVGCGGSSEEPDEPSKAGSQKTASSTPTAAPDDDLKAAVNAYSKAFLTGDGAAAYALLSERCRSLTPLSDFAAITEQAKETYGPVKIDSLDVDVSGDSATATYTYAVPAINQTDEKWVLESGSWHNDDC